MTGTRQAAGALVINQAKQVLLVHDRFRGEWAYPGGHVDSGESPLEACAREVSEEVGIELPLHRYTHIDTHRAPGHFYNVEFWSYVAHVTPLEAAQLKLQALEISQSQWVPLREVPDVVSPRFRERTQLIITRILAQSPQL